ncbi:hypothetical protein HPB51_018455 [Rhipicephalus microplus]|uniref:Uncharacterized protein n=1 Tax=Rhipicephalus microplus TaxID=6941 RepID=A0A9J6DAQ9_RHIMP|nr:hypothetical protein HPB51_018455 [Rhipicephalus microplus]
MSTKAMTALLWKAHTGGGESHAAAAECEGGAGSGNACELERLKQNSAYKGTPPCTGGVFDNRMLENARERRETPMSSATALIGSDYHERHFRVQLEFSLFFAVAVPAAKAAADSPVAPLLLSSEKPTRMPACLPKNSTEFGGPFASRSEHTKKQWQHGHTSICTATMNEIAPLIQQPKYRLKLS